MNYRKRADAQKIKDNVNVERKSFVPFTESELKEMSREEACLHLSDRERRFCEVYVKSFNAELAAKKAGYTIRGAATVARRLRMREDVRLYLSWLKLRAADSIDVRPEDILEQYIKIGFADITDYVTVKNNRVVVVDSDKIDGQVVESYKQTPKGIEIKLHDKLRALHQLEQFFADMPKSWQQRLEERRLEIAEARLRLDQEAVGIVSEAQTEIGSALLNALRGEAQKLWKEEDAQ